MKTPDNSEEQCSLSDRMLCINDSVPAAVREATDDFRAQLTLQA
ncbi:hypothetical protein [Carnimonas bestiolae]